MASFVHWYNMEHRHSSIGYVTPNQMRSGDAFKIFKKRNAVLRKSKEENPERWGKRKTMTWGAPKEVLLNPEIK